MSNMQVVEHTIEYDSDTFRHEYTANEKPIKTPEKLIFLGSLLVDVTPLSGVFREKSQLVVHSHQFLSRGAWR